MGLIFESDAFKQDPARTATHVLLIGCEDYPHLAQAGFTDGTKLGSPRRSVEAMATWFLGGVDGMAPMPGLSSDQAFNNQDAPLGTVELLASPTADYVTPAGVAKPVTRPSLIEMRAAFKRWIARLGANAQSRGVFYFCGHGVGNGVDQYLIPDDFGEDPQDPWPGAIHMSNSHQVAIRKTKASLLFLIDACREFSPKVLTDFSTPQPLTGGDRQGAILSSGWTVLSATTSNRLAYADAKGMARFTTALLQALRGYCGRRRAGPQLLFDVNGAQLLGATGHFLKRLQQPGDDKLQRLDVEGVMDAPVHILTQRPSVLVELDVDPQGYRAAAMAFIERDGTPRDQRAFKGGPANFVVPQGQWSYGVGGGVVEQRTPDVLLIEAVWPASFTIP